MSIRAKIISYLIRRTIQPHLDQVEDIDAFRQHLSTVARLNNAPPKHIQISYETINDLPCEWLQAPASGASRILFYLHGGGYVSGGLDSHRELAWRLAEAAGLKVLLVDYPLAPEYPFPKALDQVTQCYRTLLEQGYHAEDIALGGDSAGGGLAMALLLNLKNRGLPLPYRAILLSPWVDLSLSGDSIVTNVDTDVMLTPRALAQMADFYLGERDAKAALASPLYGDLRGLPPLLVHVSDSELLLSDGQRLASTVASLGGDVELTIWPQMPHVFQALAARLPEGKQAIAALGAFLATKGSS
ncbi:MAG: monoterpene epsilon-lactone hydrolase [Candidatus Azotimanducaceae bacterium]|jgi:monoterpene epsilon-lactone hydrolase